MLPGLLGGGGIVDDRAFPYATIQGLGAGQIVLGLAILAFGIAELVLHPYLWVTGLLAVWIPIFVIITGAVGASAQPSRVYSLVSIKVAFLVMSVFCIFMAIALAIVEGYLHYMWYQSAEWKALSPIRPQDMGAITTPVSPDNMYYFVIPLVVLACLEFITALVSTLVCGCCAPIMVEEDPYAMMGAQRMPRPMMQPYPAQMPGYAYQQQAYAQPTYAQQAVSMYSYPGAYQQPASVYGQMQQAGSLYGGVQYM